MLFFGLMFLLCCYFFWAWRNRRYISLYWKIGAKHIALPFVGHGYLFSGDREQVLKNFFAVADHAVANNGVSSLWMLLKFYVVIADSVDAEHVLNHLLEKDDLMSVLRLLTRTSSTFAQVPIWRPRRKIVTALLSHKNVSKFQPVFSRASEVLADQMRPLAGKESFSIWEHLNAYSLDVTCSTILGIDFNSQTNFKEPLRMAINTMLDLAADVLLKFWYRIDFIAKRTKLFKIFLENDKVIKSHVEMAMKKHQEMNVNGENEILDEEKQFSLLHMFTQLKKKREFDETMLHDESLGILSAASDTTSIAISMVALLLARHPDVQEKVYQELRDVFGESDRAVTNEDLPRLRYLEATIKEGQRLYPAAPQITRKALEDCVLPSGITVPKGTNILISIYALNRNPKYWGPDAAECRPERFLDGSVSQLPSYFSFGRGPRGCPGVQFATMSMKTALATLLRQFQLLPATPDAPPPRFLFGVTTKEADNFQVRIQARKPTLL